MRTKIMMTSVALFLLLAGLTLAAEGHEIARRVIGGGGRVEAGNYALNYTIGQPVVGVNSEGDYALCAGFWCGGKAEAALVYLPLVLRE